MEKWHDFVHIYVGEVPMLMMAPLIIYLNNYDKKRFLKLLHLSNYCYLYMIFDPTPPVVEILIWNRKQFFFNNRPKLPSKDTYVPLMEYN